MLNSCLVSNTASRFRVRATVSCCYRASIPVASGGRRTSRNARKHWKVAAFVHLYSADMLHSTAWCPLSTSPLKALRRIFTPPINSKLDEAHGQREIRMFHDRPGIPYILPLCSGITQKPIQLIPQIYYTSASEAHNMVRIYPPIFFRAPPAIESATFSIIPQAHKISPSDDPAATKGKRIYPRLSSRSTHYIRPGIYERHRVILTPHLARATRMMDSWSAATHEGSISASVELTATFPRESGVFTAVPRLT